MRVQEIWGVQEVWGLQIEKGAFLADLGEQQRASVRIRLPRQQSERVYNIYRLLVITWW